MIRVIVYPGRGGWFVDFQDGRVRKSAGPMRRIDAITMGEEAEAIWDVSLTVLDDAA